MSSAPRPPDGATDNGKSTPERVADAIGKGILMRRFVVGQRLVEADLMRDLGVGRSTVREALRILATSGVVELVPHRGAVIRALGREDAEDLLEVLEVLCGLAARLAARRIGLGNNRQRLAAAAKRLLRPRSADALSAILDERANYYRVMVEAAGNPELQRVIPAARAHLFRSQFHHALDASDLQAMVLEYRSITEAILQGDAAGAEARMRQHIRNSGLRTVPRMQPLTLARSKAR